MNVPIRMRWSSSVPRGDLAYKKIFPSLQAMIKRGHLDVPVIGVPRQVGMLISSEPGARQHRETWGRVDRRRSTNCAAPALC
jgi:Glucose-6-phosphate 1-dehydrogenase